MRIKFIVKAVHKKIVVYRLVNYSFGNDHIHRTVMRLVTNMI